MKRHSFHLLCLSIVTILLPGCVGSEEVPVATNQDGNDSSAKSQFVNMNAIEAAKILKNNPEAIKQLDAAKELRKKELTEIK